MTPDNPYGPFDPPEPDEPPEFAECKFCGKAGLHWEETDAGWQLFSEHYERHKCSNKTVAADFEDLTK
jgi:hypothetical protein